MYEIKIFTGDGELKEIVPAKTAHRLFWASLPDLKLPKGIKEKKICSECNKEFAGKTDHQKCCSPECRKTRAKRYNEARYFKGNPKIIKPCGWCRKSFAPEYHQTVNCSETCKEKWNLKLEKARQKRKYEKAKARKAGRARLKAEG